MTNHDLTREELKQAIPIDKLDQIIELKRGDTVIFIAAPDLEPKKLLSIRKQLQEYLPGVDFVLISGQVQVSVLRQAGKGHG